MAATTKAPNRPPSDAHSHMRVQQRPLFRGILFATRSGELLPPDLARVRALCELFGARLHVLRVLPALGCPNALFASHDTADTLMRLQHARRQIVAI
jgi:hypothetical protein